MNSGLSPTQVLVSQMYKDEQGHPIYLSPGQDYIFASLLQKRTPRMHIMCHTRFGKSMTVGIGVLTRAATYPEKWAIIAGTKEKAKIIMDYVIAHIFDNQFTRDRFIPEKGDDIDELRRHRSKNRLTFATDKMDGGKTLLSEIFIGSAKDALGFGADNVVEDEAALINDTEHSLVMRMLGDNPRSNFMVKIGNPFQRNHFLKSYHDPLYQKVIIDCYRSLAEGRITKEIIEENRPYPFFDVLYECKFPSASEVDETGYMQLLTEEEVRVALNRTVQTIGKRRLGFDVARGGRNYNVWTLRTDNVAQLLRKDLEPDLINTGDKAIEIIREYGIDVNEIYLDDSGIGGGVTDYLKSKGIHVNAVNNGERASEEGYLNIRAESYAGKDGLQVWLKSYGKLIADNENEWIDDLTKIRYKKDVSGRTKIEPKEEMRKRGIVSPDVADSLALTFAKVRNSRYYGINPAVVVQNLQQGQSAFGGAGWDL